MLYGGPALAACRWQGSNYYFTDEGPYTHGLSLRSGERCQRSFRSLSTAVLKRLNLLEPPANAKVELREGGYLTYVSNPGYRGSDRFMIQVCAEGSFGYGCAKLIVLVTVD